MDITGDEPGSGSSEPDWIDQILERANNAGAERNETAAVGAPTSTSHAQSPIAPASMVPAPMVPEGTGPRPVTAPIVSGTGDSLGEIRWVDQDSLSQTTDSLGARSQHAGSQHAGSNGAETAPGTSAERTLTAQAVGRSAWDEELASIGTEDPEGWDQLSWQDLDESSASQGRPMGQPSGFGSLIREWGPVLFASIAIALFTRLVLVQAYHIPSESMVPTLEDGDRVVVNRLSYQFGEIERGQVVVFAKPAGTEGENDLIKRVIGLPGETVRFVDNQVFIDGFRVEEPYLATPDSTRPRLRIPGCDQSTLEPDSCTVPEGHVFVMGDNRLGSSDSRVFGPIPTDTVVGRAFMRVWPLNHLGEL